MPRILIADDNSNIQRMAALALKDAGIEVVAVGNGEAAMRKIPEVSPDLVLADIFMPVRNGYEVCEFVKHSPKYSSTPVLLLAGAFDPFDEHEAQRVQADGILKKPFVPPDPLINAVKTLLEKSAGERLMAVTVPVEAEASAQDGASATASATATATAAEPSAEDAEAQAYTQPSSVVDFLAAPKKDSTKVTTSSFAPSLSIEPPEAEEPETVVTASRDPILGEPAFWVPEEQEQESESEPVEEESVADLTDHTWTSASRPAPMRDDPDPLPVAAPKPLPDLEPVKLEPPKPAAAAVHQVDLSGLARFPPEAAKEPAKESTKPSAYESPAPELPPFEPIPSPAALSAFPAAISAPAAASPYAEQNLADDTAPLPDAAVESTPFELALLQDSPLLQPETKLSEAQVPQILDAAQPSNSPAIPEAPSTLTNAAEPIEPPAAAVTGEYEEESSLFELADALPAFPEFAAPIAPAPEPQPAIQQKAAEPQVAADWPPIFVPVTSPSSKETAPFTTPSTSETGPLTSPSANETQEPAVELASAQLAPSAPLTLQREAVPAPPLPISIQRDAAPESASEPAPAPAAPTIASLSPEAQEAVIQRIIERMQPQIAELVTRQILRPLVESLVRNELGEK